MSSFERGQAFEGADVMMIDVVFPGAFDKYLLDLNPALGDEARQHRSELVANNTVHGKLLAMPWFVDLGVLYYRPDLLQKYNIAGPPRTWAQLRDYSQQIMEGERSASPATFELSGFVFQGGPHEALICNILEWLASRDGGILTDGRRATIDNDQVRGSLTSLHDWISVDKIVPGRVLASGYTEERTREDFLMGKAVFMREWSSAYASMREIQDNPEESRIGRNFAVTRLPAGMGQTAVATVGGWGLAVYAGSANQGAAMEFVRYMTSWDVQLYRAAVGSFVPTINALTYHPEVVRALPFLEDLRGVRWVLRPSTVLGGQYRDASDELAIAVNSVLRLGNADVLLPRIQQNLDRRLGLAAG